MTVTVIGIDPSLRRTGLARVTIAADGRTAIAETCVHPSSGTRHARLTERGARLVGVATAAVEFAVPCDLVVIEGPSLGSGGVGSAWDRAGLWWRIVARLLGHTRVAVVPPQTRAKWVTGSGRADKHAVHEAISRLWGASWPATSTADDNEADALVLGSMGAQWLGVLPMTGPDPAALAGAAWPDREGITS